MQSLGRLLAADASLLPTQSALAQERAAAGRGGGCGGHDVHAVQLPQQQQQRRREEPQNARLPSLLEILLMGIAEEQQHCGAGDASCGGGGAAGELPGLPSWIPADMFAEQVGAGMGAPAAAAASNAWGLAWRDCLRCRARARRWMHSPGSQAKAAAVAGAGRAATSGCLPA